MPSVPDGNDNDLAIGSAVPPVQAAPSTALACCFAARRRDAFPGLSGVLRQLSDESHIFAR